MEAAPVAAPTYKVQKPVAPVAAASASSSAQSSRVRTIGGAAAVVVVVAAIGFPLGKLWLGGQETSPIVRDAPPAQPVQQAAAAPQRAATSPSVVATPAPAAPAPAESTVQEPPRVRARDDGHSAEAGRAAGEAARDSCVPYRPQRASRAKGSRPTTPLRPAVTAPAPTPVAVAPAPEVVAPPPVAAPAPKPEPPAAVGPFFELRDVNETPRVATRVEPQVPDDLRDRQLNEVVIVRVLVTQAGHPSLVNLLRRSKAGPSLDNAIVAAVKQWTFVPAKKRGEAVSCWFHVGVPVSAN